MLHKTDLRWNTRKDISPGGPGPPPPARGSCRGSTVGRRWARAHLRPCPRRRCNRLRSCRLSCQGSRQPRSPTTSCRRHRLSSAPAGSQRIECAEGQQKSRQNMPCTLFDRERPGLALERSWRSVRSHRRACLRGMWRTLSRPPPLAPARLHTPHRDWPPCRTFPAHISYSLWKPSQRRLLSGSPCRLCLPRRICLPRS